jgi:hypothetical protein
VYGLADNGNDRVAEWLQVSKDFKAAANHQAIIIYRRSVQSVKARKRIQLNIPRP